MKTDLDALMEANEIDALLVTGPAQHNPAMYYFTGGWHISQGDLIKKRGQEPVLFYNSMERDEAAKTGLHTKDLGDYRLRDLLKEKQRQHGQSDGAALPEDAGRAGHPGGARGALRQG